MIRSIRKLLLFTMILLSSGNAVAWAEEPFRLLYIPVSGPIGIDCTPEGVKEAVSLAVSSNFDGILVSIESTNGHLETGEAIASAIRSAGGKLQTIALLRQAGGAALPIAFACEQWLILEQTTELAPDRIVASLGAAWPGPDGDLSEEAVAIRDACVTAMQGVELTEFTAQARLKLADCLGMTNRDLLMWSPATPVQTIPMNSPTPNGATRIKVASQGPGIDLGGLVLSQLGVSIGQGIEPLARALGVAEVEPQGDIGAQMVNQAADEIFRNRQNIGTLIDSSFATLDGIDSLRSSFDWTLERAKISNPNAEWRRYQYTMEIKDGQWVLTEEGSAQWNLAIDKAIRRWRGVVNTAEEIGKLVSRSRELHERLKGMTANQIDRDRLESARTLLGRMLPERYNATSGILPWAQQGIQRIARFEAMKKAPPTAPVKAK